MGLAFQTMPTGLTVRCPAKINLHLRVAPPRPDGFHPLLSWMCTVGFFDTLTINPAPVGGPPITLSCDDPSLPIDDRNLVVRIVRGLAGSIPSGSLQNSLRAHLVKRIPAGAGLGGGSADAACALLAAARLWTSSSWEPIQDLLAEVAARYGSDIPFFLQAPSAACSGRGDIVRPIPRPFARFAVLLLPTIHMPTPDVYRRFDQMHLGQAQDVEIEPDWSAWGQLKATDLLPQLVNDLEPAAFSVRPELGELRKTAEQVANRIVRMSGSGSSLFTLADDEGQAQNIGERWSMKFAPSIARIEIAEVAPLIELRPQVDSRL